MIEDITSIKEALRRAVPPVGGHGPERDLWPALARRITVGREPRLVWLDWIVAAGAVSATVALPAMVPAVLYLL